MKRRRFLQIAAAAVAIPARASAETVWDGVALGADVSITLRGDRKAADRALARIEGLLQVMEAEFSLFRPDSALSQLNATGRLRPSADFLSLARVADRVHGLTGGLFDPTIQPLWLAVAEGRPAEAARAAIGWTRVRLARDEIRLEPGQALTFNGIAQGYATDRARALLAEEGFTEALINIGEYAALGGLWRLGIADPVWGILAERRLAGGAFATSSPGAMALGGAGHILAPDGRAPRWSTVAVEAQDATLADGLSTAMCLMSGSEIIRLKATMPGLRSVTLISASGDLTTV